MLKGIVNTLFWNNGFQAHFELNKMDGKFSLLLGSYSE